MKIKKISLCCIFLLSLCLFVRPVHALTIISEGFGDDYGFKKYKPGKDGKWERKKLAKTKFKTGSSSQKGEHIFFGEKAKHGKNSNPVPYTLSFADIDLTKRSHLRLSVSLAAAEGPWEYYSESRVRDSLEILFNDISLDIFMGEDYLKSKKHGTSLGWEFQDFVYDIDVKGIDSGTGTLSFAFMSTSGNEEIGIDSILLENPPTVPEPTTLLLLGTGLVGVGLAGFGRRGISKSKKK